MNPVTKRLLERVVRSTRDLCTSSSFLPGSTLEVDESWPEDGLLTLIIRDKAGLDMQTQRGFECGVIYTLTRLHADKIGMDVSTGYTSSNFIMRFIRKH